MSLALLVPSRGRPHNIARLAQAMRETCTGETMLVVGLDEDDPALPGYEQVLAEHPDITALVRPGLRQVVAWTNTLAAACAGRYEHLGAIGDDNVPRTPGWDARIIQALRGTPFAFGNDLYPGRAPGTLCCHVFCRADVVEKLGYFGPPGIRHMYVDVAWYAWGRACGITYLDDVVIEHMHYSAGKSPADDSYRASTALIPEDLRNWHEYCRSGSLNRDVALLGGEPFTPQALERFNGELGIPREA